jgi:hypothetical protein
LLGQKLDRPVYQNRHRFRRFDPVHNGFERFLSGSRDCPVPASSRTGAVTGSRSNRPVRSGFNNIAFYETSFSSFADKICTLLFEMVHHRKLKSYDWLSFLDSKFNK